MSFLCRGVCVWVVGWGERGKCSRKLVLLQYSYAANDDWEDDNAGNDDIDLKTKYSIFIIHTLVVIHQYSYAAIDDREDDNNGNNSSHQRSTFLNRQWPFFPVPHIAATVSYALYEDNWSWIKIPSNKEDCKLASSQNNANHVINWTFSFFLIFQLLGAGCHVRVVNKFH